MPDPFVRQVGATITDLDEIPVMVGIDYDTVTIQVGAGLARLGRHQACQFIAEFADACWQAARSLEPPQVPGVQA